MSLGCHVLDKKSDHPC